MWKVNAAMVALLIIAGVSRTPSDRMVDGRNTVPSTSRATGANMQKATIVINEKRPIEPPTCTHVSLKYIAFQIDR